MSGWVGARLCFLRYGISRLCTARVCLIVCLICLRVECCLFGCLVCCLHSNAHFGTENSGAPFVVFVLAVWPGEDIANSPCFCRFVKQNIAALFHPVSHIASLFYSTWSSRCLCDTTRATGCCRVAACDWAYSPQLRMTLRDCSKSVSGSR